MNKDIQVKIAGKDSNYPIFIEETPIEELKTKIQKITNDSNYLVVISKKVHKLYGKALGFDKTETLIIPDGESEKNFRNYLKILERLTTMNITKKGHVIAIGGGVIGDMAGFAAATYRRGIGFIQVPTTLLACVDSSVGGKVAVNCDFSKNMVGAFYQPTAVFINLNFLTTLDETQYMSGIGEIIKYAFIEKSCMSLNDYKFFDFLNVNHKKIMERDFNFLDKIIRISLALKIAVVTKDEKESGLRKILNLGHTYGHALETFTKFSKFTHGAAVVQGLFFIFKYAHKMKMIDANYRESAYNFMNKYGFKEIPAKCFNKKAIIEIMKSDKKAESNKIKVIVPIAPAFVNEFELDIEKAFEETK